MCCWVNIITRHEPVDPQKKEVPFSQQTRLPKAFGKNMEGDLQTDLFLSQKDLSGKLSIKCKRAQQRQTAGRLFLTDPRGSHFGVHLGVGF
jgi:hypothetical protein